MLNVIEVFDVIQRDPATGRSMWAGLTGTRMALKRDGHALDPKAMTYCPAEWIDERGYFNTDLVRQHPRLWGI